jgi:hypothetical protein
MKRAVIASVAAISISCVQEPEEVTLFAASTLEEQIAIAQTRLDQAEQALADFRRRNETRLPIGPAVAEEKLDELRRLRMEMPSVLTDELDNGANVTKDWRPFSFNGHTFYVVPLGL